MTKETVRAAVDQYCCFVDGVRYDFKLEWAAVERYTDAQLPRHLLRLQVLSTTHAARRPLEMHLYIWLPRLADLPSMLEDSLRHHLAERALSRESERRPAYRAGLPGRGQRPSATQELT